MNLTLNDLNTIKELLFSAFLIGIYLAFIFFVIARGIINKIISRINFPHRIRTEDGYLYRSLNGTYVSQKRKKDIEFERKLKNKDRWIRRHEYALKRLRG